MRNAPTVELGPENWFEAWWLTGQERHPTGLARDDRGKPTLLGLAHDELKLVDAVLVRAWCDGPRDWQAAEWSELKDLESRLLDHLDELRHRDGSLADGTPGVVLGLPPTSHAMFEPAGPNYLLAESWRLEGHRGLADWLTGAVKPRSFATRARANVQLRRIAVEAAKRAPTAATFDVLRRIYRDVRSRDGVVAADQEFLAKTPGAGPFANAIAEFGLHADFSRTRFLPRSRKPRRTGDLATTPRITVVIPSFRHESFVALAIESCLQQSISDLRVLVADDRSPDGTVAAARAIDDPRLRVVENERNLGLGASVLAALQQVDTPFVALLNSDDVFHPDRLGRCLTVLEGDAGAMLAASGFAVVDAAGNVLTPATSCAAEIGPNAHGWLRWHDGIARDELRTPDDWVAFEVLLRHNVLATSSNMVFRTNWLREHMPEASKLKYCVDWQLFLQAAMEGSLRMVEGALLAYRLHDSNTVWFREGGRTDYVLEVNRVVDRVVHQWLERTVARDGGAKAIERLAVLLDHDARSHGEVVGLALYLTDLVNRHAPEAVDVVDARSGALVTLVESGLRRKTYDRVFSQLDVDPWSLPWRVQLADRWRLEHDVADGYAARARALQESCAHLRSEVDAIKARELELLAHKARAAAELSAARQAKAQVDADLVAAVQAKAQVDASLIAAAQTNTQTQADLVVAQTEQARLRTMAEALGADVVRRTEQHEHRLAAEQRESQRLRAEKEQATISIRRLQEELHALRVEAEQRVARLEAMETSQEHLTRQLEHTSSELLQREIVIESQQDDLQVALAEQDAARNRGLQESRLRDRAIGIALAERRAALARTRSPSWRLGDVLMRRVGLLGAYKTLAAWARLGASTLARGTWYLRRLTASRERSAATVVVFADAQDGATIDERCLRWRATNEQSIRIVVPGGCVPRSAVHDVRDVVWLTEDARLANRDRRHFQARVPAAVEAVEKLFPTNAPVTHAWRGTRMANAYGAAVTVAHGLRRGAIAGYATKVLCGTPMVLVLGDEDLLALHIPTEAAAAILRAADLLIVDSELVLRTAERLAVAPATRSLIRWAIAPNEPSAARQPRSQLRAFVDLRGCQRTDPTTLVAATLHARSAGLDLVVDVVGPSTDDAAGFRRWLLLQDAVQTSGLTQSFRMHGEQARASRQRLLDEADLALWVGTSAEGAGLPDLVVESLAIGKPVVASAVPEIQWLPAVAEYVTLVEPGNASSLAAALQQFHAEFESITRRLTAGRELMRQRADDEDRSWFRALRAITAR